MTVPARSRVIRDSIGVGVAVGAYGVAFGAASVAAGLSVLQTSLLSLLAFTGGTQFAVVGVLAGGGAVASAVSRGLLLGARNTLYAMRMAPMLRVRGARRWLAALGTIDESTAMAIAQPTPALSRVGFWWTFAGVYVFWNLCTLIGAASASALGNTDRYGLDAVVPAAFLALLAPRLRAARSEHRAEPVDSSAGEHRGKPVDSPAGEHRAEPVVSAAIERRVGLGAAVIALVLIPFTPPGVPVLAATAALLLAAVGPTGRRT